MHNMWHVQQCSVMDNSFSSKFETVFSHWRPRKSSTIRPFPLHVVPYCGLWKGSNSQAHFGPGVWRDNIHFGHQNTIIDSPLLAALKCLSNGQSWTVDFLRILKLFLHTGGLKIGRLSAPFLFPHCGL